MANEVTSKKSEGGLLDSPLLKLDEAAALLNVSKRTVQDLVASNAFEVIKFGRNTRFSRSDLEAFIERRRISRAGWKARN